ncbi:MAG: ATP-binding protein [Pseudomonadales bacterium]
MALIHLIEGPVGAGKSTLAAALSLRHRAVHLNLDEWMVTLFRPDRPDDGFLPWYLERKDRCIRQIWDVTRGLIESGTDAVLELGLVQAADREAFYRRVDGTGYALRVYLVDAPEEVRRQRVRDRNQQRGHTFRMEVDDATFEFANRAWQPPDPDECESHDIQVVKTHGQGL